MVAHRVRVAGAAGSNPVIPIFFIFTPMFRSQDSNIYISIFYFRAILALARITLKKSCHPDFFIFTSMLKSQDSNIYISIFELSSLSLGLRSKSPVTPILFIYPQLRYFYIGLKYFIGNRIVKSLLDLFQRINRSQVFNIYLAGSQKLKRII